MQPRKAEPAGPSEPIAPFQSAPGADIEPPELFPRASGWKSQCVAADVSRRNDQLPRLTAAATGETCGRPGIPAWIKLRCANSGQAARAERRSGTPQHAGVCPWDGAGLRLTFFLGRIPARTGQHGSVPDRPLGRKVLACRRDSQFTVLDAFEGNQFVSDLFDEARAAPHQQYLQTIVVV
jgi:hypothetical protein